MRKQTYGFGVDPAQSKNHFFVLMPQKELDDAPLVQIYERYSWTNSDEQNLEDSDVLRIEISKHKWGEVKLALINEFNARLKKEGLKVGKFAATGGTPIERLFGKEMMVLLWGIENADPSYIPTAIRNWRGLMPEERWWLYTMTNAATGNINDKTGWRAALRFALCENPVVDRLQVTVFDDDIGKGPIIYDQFH
ncbi:MAG: DUF3780 domain-containing protein [Clostridiales bacterium]|jgi:hypothetical protein|nr:DUF3780 domain-containing protein [Clostridiales bacterium]